MTYVDPTTQLSAVTGSTAKPNGTTLDKDGFLKLLVEQLRQQDPTQPGDATQYTQQMTQYSILEQLTNLNTAATKQSADADRASALSLVGKTVSYSGEDGARHSGVVNHVSFTSDGPSLTVGIQTGVSLDAVTDLSADAPATP